MKITLTILCFVAVAHVALAAPTITGMSGNVSHGSAVTVSGTGFGVKNPAAPLLWDDGTSNPLLSRHYDGWLPTNAQMGAQYNMAYRPVPFRGVNGPNARVQYILGGAHAQNNGDSASGSANVGIGKNITSHSYFINFYYRVDPLFDEENNPTYTDNMKEIVLSNTPGSFYPDGWGAFAYAAWCNDPGKDVPDVNYRGSVVLARIPIDPAHQNLPYSCGGNNLVYHNSPINGWIKMQWEGNYNVQYDSPQIALTTYPDGKRTEQSHYGDGLTILEWARGPWFGYPKANDLRFIGLGGFARVPRINNGVNSFRYFSAVYMDNTRARVMLGNSPDYASCTIMEPQIPLAWSDGTIQFRINLGALPDTGSAYLYVFDANNVRNLRGYPVSIGIPAPADSLSPSYPPNLISN